ncbi:hypothetical protein E2320_002140, partial [Naja naja]
KSKDWFNLPTQAREPKYQVKIKWTKKVQRKILAQFKKPILKNKSWFDRDCVQLKRTYNKEYRKSKNAPSEDHTHYLKQSKAQYKTLLKKRKESWHRLIAAVETKNISLFWHITRGLGKSPLSPTNQVPIHAREEYFRELYTVPDIVTKESQISWDQTPYWPQKSLRTGSIYLPRLESQNTLVKIKWTKKSAKEITKWMLVPETIELCTSLLKNKFEGSYLVGFETLISNLKSVLTNNTSSIQKAHFKE